MFGYIYKTTDLTNKIYIGKKTSTKFLGTSYTGSGTQITKIINECKSVGIDLSERFDVSLIDVAYSAEELNIKERFWISFYNSRNNDIGYNICKGGVGGPGGPKFKGHSHSVETKQKMSHDRMGDKNSNYGNRWHRTPDMNYGSTFGENNHFYGKHHTEENKRKIGAINREHQKGRIVIHKDDIERHVLPKDLDQYLDSGFIIGKKTRKIH